VQVAPFVAAANTWYILELEWRATGDMIARIYDESGKAVLAETPAAATGFTTPGGVAIRGFGGAGIVHQIDDISQVPAFEDFEHGNEGLYAQQTPGDNMAVSGGSAHTGSFGAEFVSGASGWRTRFDLPTSPGHQYRAYVRAFGPIAGAGRTYIGVGAAAGGAFSAVFAPNTSEIILQDNSGYGFTDVVAAPFVPAPFDWYILALDWRRNGQMRVKIYDESGINLLAQTAAANTGFNTAGGLAIRGFTTAVGNFQDTDDYSFTTFPVCYPDCNGDGALTVADFGCFQTLFVSGSCYADCNGDGVRTVADFGCFQTKFVTGCP
jgi:hypothetical protein